MNTFDVIIVGAGPAGSLLGYFLTLKKINVLIIDKKKLPRQKTCGGGLTRRALDILPFDISEVIESYPHTVSISVQNTVVFQYTSHSPIIGMVMRDRFDYFLIKKAISQGATVMDEAVFRHVSGMTGHLSVETSKGVFKTKIIAGADGVYSKTAKALHLETKKKTMIGIEAEVYCDSPTLFNEFRRSAGFDFGVVPKGYGWIFPKKEHLSIGVGSLSKKVKGMQQYLYRYLETKKLKNHSHIQSMRGWLIPYGPSKNSLYANEKGLLLGDAAGLTDPITGEGMFYALREADIASRVILDALSGKQNLSVYHDAIKTLQQDLTYALKLQGLLYKVPRISYMLMNRHGNRLGKNYIDIITGKTTYYKLYKKIFSVRGVKRLFFTQDKNSST